jgi:UDP-N-acetyl-D-galactosamine dehydrogenase
LKSFGVKVEVVDFHAEPKEIKKEYGFELQDEITGKFDAVIVAVSHQPYLKLDEDFFKSISTEKGILIDIKGLYRNKINDLTYWSL